MVNEVTETFGESRNPPVGFRNTLGKSKRGPKVVTKCHTTQRGATQSKVLPYKAPTKHVYRHMVVNNSVQHGLYCVDFFGLRIIYRPQEYLQECNVQ